MWRRSLLTVLLGCGLVGCPDGADPPVVGVEILQGHEEASQVLFGLEHYMASEGIRRAKVVADTGYIQEDETLVELSVMEVTFYDTRGEISSILTAREGTYDWDTGDMTARHDVVVVDPVDGERLETSVLYYERLSDRIWSDQPTKMFRADGTVVEGSTFESNSAMDEVNLTSPRFVRPGEEQPEPNEGDPEERIER
jgi:LPS export ABC transporter protein LptC